MHVIFVFFQFIYDFLYFLTTRDQSYDEMQNIVTHTMYVRIPATAWIYIKNGAKTDGHRMKAYARTEIDGKKLYTLRIGENWGSY